MIGLLLALGAMLPASAVGLNTATDDSDLPDEAKDLDDRAAGGAANAGNMLDDLEPVVAQDSDGNDVIALEPGVYVGALHADDVDLPPQAENGHGHSHDHDHDHEDDHDHPAGQAPGLSVAAGNVPGWLANGPFQLPADYGHDDHAEDDTLYADEDDDADIIDLILEARKDKTDTESPRGGGPRGGDSTDDGSPKGGGKGGGKGGSTEEPVEPTPEEPVDPAPEEPVEPTPEEPVDPAPEEPVEPTPEEPVDPAPEEPVEPTPEEPVDPAPEEPVEPTPEEPVDPAPEEPVEPTPEEPVDPAPEEPVEPTPEEPVTPELMTSYISGEEGGFNVEIQFEGTWTPELQQAFVDAAEYISDVILADIPDVGGDYNVDDIRIEARLTDIDGAGGVLGQAGPTVVRGGDAPLPVTGIMEFDIADADYYNDNGLWDDIILHEMLHTLGLGTMWSYVGLTSGSVEGGDLRFTGANATAAYNSEFADIAANDAGSASGVPVETHGGSGTAGGHWDEELFGNELATGYVNGSNYVSSMTLASLEDLGYDTVIDDVTRDGDMTGPIPADPLNTAPTNVA